MSEAKLVLLVQQDHEDRRVSEEKLALQVQLDLRVQWDHEDRKEYRVLRDRRGIKANQDKRVQQDHEALWVLKVMQVLEAKLVQWVQ